MTELLTYFSPILTWVLTSLGSVITAITDEPLLLLMVILGLVGVVFSWARSFIHI